MTSVIVSRPMPVFDWCDETESTIDTGMKEIRFEGCGCCSDEIVINDASKPTIIDSIIRMREIINAVMAEANITEDEIRERM